MQKMDVVLEGDEGFVKSERTRKANKSGKHAMREVLAGEEEDHRINRGSGSGNEEKKDELDGKESGGGDDNEMKKGEIDYHADASQQLRKEDTISKQTENKDRPTQSGNTGEEGPHEETNNLKDDSRRTSDGDSSDSRHPSPSLQSTTSQTLVSPDHEIFGATGHTLPSSATSNEDESSDGDSSSEGSGSTHRSHGHTQSTNSLRVETGRLSLEGKEG
ncbi:MAG: hypothetical protein Q9187_006301 [Circinaria calcarea]